jgi:hypothetical protein
MTHDGFDPTVPIDATSFLSYSDAPIVQNADRGPTLETALAQAGLNESIGAGSDAPLLDRSTDIAGDLWIGHGAHSVFATLHTDAGSIGGGQGLEGMNTSSWGTGQNLDGSDGLDPSLRFNDFLPQGNYFDLSACAMTSQGDVLLDWMYGVWNNNIVVNGHVPDGVNVGFGYTLVLFGDGVRSLYRDDHWFANVTLTGLTITQGPNSFGVTIGPDGGSISISNGDHITYNFHIEPGR